MNNHNVTFGKTDLLVSKISFGGNVFGWTLDEKGSFELLDAFIDAGFNFIDTADSYSTWVPGNIGGESETIIGKWMKIRGNRDKVVVATKLGSEVKGEKGLGKVYMKKAVDRSLRNLQTNYIDLYISHYDDPNTPVEETMEGFNELIKEGKVRYIGASNLSADRIAQSNQFAKERNLQGYVSLQPLYNLFDREKFENEYLQLVKDEDLAVTSYYALASGFLSGKYRTKEDSAKSPRGEGIVAKYLNERGERILSAMDTVSEQTGASLSQIAIAWQLNKPYITSPIASATSVSQLNEWKEAVNLRFSNEQMALLDEASKVIQP
jgi:Predicted oxidoreductases (related to aryl-alcohol dehydrogenases)